MKKVNKTKRYRYYRRLFHRLFWLYAEKSDNPVTAISFAKNAFVWLTGVEYDDLLKNRAFWDVLESPMSEE